MLGTVRSPLRTWSAAHDRPAARLLRAPSRRRRPGGRGGPRRRAGPPASHPRDDRVGELRAAGDPRVPGQRADQQVRGGLSRQALLRRLRVRRRHRAARDRPREGAVRRRARQRAAARRRAGQHVRDDRSARRLLQPAARRGRSRDRRRARARARAPAAHAGDDRVGELRAAGRPRVPGLRADEQVRRGLSRQALLRRLRVRRRDRAARDRSREGAVRRRARQRAAARRRAGQRRRLPRAAAAGRHDPGPRAPARRPPHPRHEDQRVRPAVRHRALRGRSRDAA